MEGDIIMSKHVEAVQ